MSEANTLNISSSKVSIRKCAKCGIQSTGSPHYVSCGGESRWTEKTKSGVTIHEFSEKDEVVVWELMLCHTCLAESIKAVSAKRLKSAKEDMDLLRSSILFGLVIVAILGFLVYYLHTHIVFGGLAAIARIILPFPLSLVAIMLGVSLLFLPLATFLLHRAREHEKRTSEYLKGKTIPKQYISDAILEAAERFLREAENAAGQMSLFSSRFILPNQCQMPKKAEMHPARLYLRKSFGRRILATGETPTDAIPRRWQSSHMKSTIGSY